MNGYIAVALLLAVILATIMGTVIYVGETSVPKFPTKGTMVSGNTTIVFDGAKSRVTEELGTKKLVFYKSGVGAPVHIAEYRYLPSELLSAGEKPEDYMYFVSNETKTKTSDFDFATVIGKFVSEVDGMKTYKYCIGIICSEVTFDSTGKLYSFGSGESVKVLDSFSDEVSGSFEFDYDLAVASNALVDAKFKKKADAARLLKQSDSDRKLGAGCNIFSAIGGLIDNGGKYGNWCGNGQNWKCAGTGKWQYMKSDGGKGLGPTGGSHKAVCACDDGGFDLSCAKHDHGAYNEKLWYGLTGSLCEVDRLFYLERSAAYSGSGIQFDGSGTNTKEAIEGASCLFSLVGCLTYESYKCSGWWIFEECKSNYYEAHHLNTAYGDYVDAIRSSSAPGGRGCKDDTCFKFQTNSRCDKREQSCNGKNVYANEPLLCVKVEDKWKNCNAPGFWNVYCWFSKVFGIDFNGLIRKTPL